MVMVEMDKKARRVSLVLSLNCGDVLFWRTGAGFG